MKHDTTVVCWQVYQVYMQSKCGHSIGFFCQIKFFILIVTRFQVVFQQTSPLSVMVFELNLITVKRLLL
jgi:hypothetical protein